MTSEVCDLCGVPHVASGVYVCVSNRFDVVLGKAVYNRASTLRRRLGKINGDGITEDDSEYVLGIIINNSLFWHINNRCQVEIIVHETCHIIDFYMQIQETGRIKAEHSDRWKSLMWACGFVPREGIPVSELGIQYKHQLYCPSCNVHHNTTRQLSARVKNKTSKRYCGDCSEELIHPDFKSFNVDKNRMVG